MDAIDFLFRGSRKGRRKRVIGHGKEEGRTFGNLWYVHQEKNSLPPEERMCSLRNVCSLGQVVCSFRDSLV